MPRPIVGRLGGHVAQIAINVVLPLLIYDWLAPAHGDVQALLASTVPPLLYTVGGLVLHRRVDAVSALVLAGIVLSLFAMIGGGSARLLQLRENLVTGVLGLVFLGSAAIGRPLIYQLAQAGLRRKSPDELAAFEAMRDRPRFRRTMTFMTIVWGVGLLVASLLSCVLVLTLSIHDALVATPCVGYGAMGGLGLWTAWYSRRAKRRAAAA